VGLGFRANPPDFRLLSLIPLFTLPFVVIHVRHNMIIAYIGEYFDEELQPFLFGCVESKTLSSPKHWDQSSNLKHRLASFLRYEAVAHFLFLCGPALFVLWIAWDQRNTMSSLYWPGLVLTSVATLIVFWQFVRGDPFSNFWHSRLLRKGNRRGKTTIPRNSYVELIFYCSEPRVTSTFRLCGH
jgi:hypothetical protein